MMALFAVLVLTFMQFAAGAGLLNLIKARFNLPVYLALSILLGIGIFSLVPFLLQLFFIPLTAINLLHALVVSCIILNVRSVAAIRVIKNSWRRSKFLIRLYEVPFLAIVLFIVFVSVWRCFYYPPTPRDLTSGAEVIAAYAVREKTMINSVFTVNLESTNNQFKPPFIASLQIIYKYAGFPFGQVWLSTVFIAFLIFLFHAAAEKVHRLIAWMLILCFLVIPEMYAYTIMVLFDYSNAVFFALSVYALVRYFKEDNNSFLFLSALLMALATYVRSETLLLACLFAPVIFFQSIRRAGIKTTTWRTTVFLIFSVAIYILTVSVYVNHYLPVKYNVAGLINTHLFDLRPLLKRFEAINSRLIFSNTGITYYAYFIFLFIGILVSDLLFIKQWSKEGKNWLMAVVIVFAGLPLIGFLLPLMDVDNSTKRGMFKLFPLMLLFMANSTAVKKLSDKLTTWERS